MGKVSTYLNFTNRTEEAFNFYKKVFGTEFVDGIHRMSEVPPHEGQNPLSEEDKNLVMNVQLPIVGGHLLMGTDAPESLRPGLIIGNNVNICLDLDTREEADKYFKALSEGGKVEMQLQDMFWGSYFGSCTDKFGICWMFNCSNKK